MCVQQSLPETIYKCVYKFILEISIALEYLSCYTIVCKLETSTKGL